MGDAENMESEGAVRLEWWYDLDRPFLANADLLGNTSRYATSIATEDGVFGATVRLPRIPDDRDGLATFLAPPCDWLATTPEPDEAWGTHWKESALGFKGVSVKRLAFDICVVPAQVAPAIRSEWGSYLLELEVLNNIDTWWETVRTWLEIATNQRLTQVGHEAVESLNPHTRTSVWTVDDSNGRQQSLIGGTVVRGPERVLGVSTEILRDCLALATTRPPLAWVLLRDARALQNADQYRRAVIDAATAAEIAATRLIDGLVVGRTQEERNQLLKQYQTLGGKAKLLTKLGDPPPATFRADLIDRRNDAVHEGLDVGFPEWKAAFRQALTLVEKAFPLPTAPGSSTPLTCHWSRSLEVSNLFASTF